MLSKEHLLLLPGMMCDERLWYAQIEALDGVCASIQVADFSSSDSIAGLAQDVLAHAPSRFALAGLSMGGIVAFELWRQAPERITRMALLDTNACAETDERREMRDDLLIRVLRGELKSVLVDSLKPRYLAQANRNNQALLDMIITMALDLGEEVYARQSNALANRQDSMQTLGTITVPTLVMCGQEDALCPVEFHERIANEIPNAHLVVLEKCGHLSSMEQPEQVSNELAKWLELVPEQREKII